MGVLAYIRKDDDQKILCVVNLSGFVQPVSLDLSRYVGRAPIELIGEIPFPAITEAPYFLSLGPHTFYWFRLDPPAAGPDAQLSEPSRSRRRRQADRSLPG